MVCNDCHDVLMMCIDIKSILVLNIKSVDYSCINFGISKSEAVNLLKYPNLSDLDLYKI